MAEVTTNHDTIRKWAGKKGGKPAAVARTHQRGDVGIVRRGAAAQPRRVRRLTARDPTSAVAAGLIKLVSWR